MRVRYIFSLVVLLSLATGASAQFTLNTVEPSAQLKVPANIYHVPLKMEIINDAKSLAMRKALWRHRNLVDTKITFTGSVTQYNNAWSSNGGQNTVSGLLMAYYYHTYGKNRFTTIFKFDGQYGMNFVDEIWFKNQDFVKFYFLSSWKLKKDGMLKNWAYSFSAAFTTQFSEGLKSRTEKDIWSNFMAPGTLNGGLGLTYTSPDPKLPFLVTIEPISGNVLFVMDGRIKPDRRQKLGIPVTTIFAEDGTTVIGHDYKNYKAEGGSALTVSFNRTFKFGKKQGFTMQYNTVFKSFYGWITGIAKHDPDNTIPTIYPVVNWTNAINLNPLKFLTLQFATTTVYDKSQINKIQMQYFISVGLTYAFKNK